MGRNSYQPSRRQQNLMQQAQRNGIFAIRRKLDPESYGVLDDPLAQLGDIIGGGDRVQGNISITSNLSTTIVGLSRYRPAQIKTGPSTASVVGDSEKLKKSLRRPITAEIGKLGLFAADTGRPKLAFLLHSARLWEEIRLSEQAFDNKGLSLRNIQSGDGKVKPHCSVGFLFKDYIPKYSADRGRQLERIGQSLGVTGCEITFLPFQSQHMPELAATIDSHGKQLLEGAVHPVQTGAEGIVQGQPQQD